MFSLYCLHRHTLNFSTGCMRQLAAHCASNPTLMHLIYQQLKWSGGSCKAPNALHSAQGTTHSTAALRPRLTSKSAPSEMRSHTRCSLAWQTAMPQVRLQLLWVSQTSGEVTFLQLLYHLRCDLTLLVPLNGKPQCLKQGCSCCGYHILQGESSSCSF